MNTYFHNTYYNLVDNFGQTIFCKIVFGWQSTTKEVKHALFYFENKTCFVNNRIYSGVVACLAQQYVLGLDLDVPQVHSLASRSFPVVSNVANRKKEQRSKTRQYHQDITNSKQISKL